MKNPFDYFEKITCISPSSDKLRWNYANKVFTKLGIETRIEKYDNKIDLDLINQIHGQGWNKTDYCHYEIILNAYHKKCKNILIFENDIQLENYDDKTLLKSLKSLDDIDWSMFFLGGTPHNVTEITDTLIKVNMCQVHAYAINGKYFKDILIELANNKIPIDQTYKLSKNKIGEKIYASHKNMFSQKLDEDIPREKLPHRKLVSEFKWKSVVEPVLNLYNKNISFVACSTGDNILERKIKNNFLESLKKNDICTSDAFVKVKYIDPKKSFRKLSEIKNQLSQNKICFFCDTRVVFLKNCFDEMLKLTNQYDIIIMGDGGSMKEYEYNSEILNTSFCIIKPSDYTRSLFYFKGSGPSILNYKREHISFFNDKLNYKNKFTKNLKIKILNPSRFCMSDMYDATKDESILNYDTEENFSKHPRSVISEMKKNKHWYIDDE